MAGAGVLSRERLLEHFSYFGGGRGQEPLLRMGSGTQMHGFGPQTLAGAQFMAFRRPECEECRRSSAEVVAGAHIMGPRRPECENYSSTTRSGSQASRVRGVSQ